MALQKKTFKIRAVTAIFFVIIMLCGLFLNKWSFFFLFLIILFGSLYEFFKILKKIWPNKYFLYLFFSLFYIIIPVCMMWDLGLQFLKENFQLSRVIYAPLFPCAIIFSIWINDTMAYIVGSLAGKTPFSKISPNKTWEGTIGGAILCIVVISLLSQVIPTADNYSIIHWISIAAICAVFGTLGDLLESKLKRMAQIKDSGTFMPGHGGFLDRFDSLLVAVPFVWIYVYLFL